MDSMLSFLLAVFLQVQFRRTFCYTNTCTVVSIFTLTTFKPDILSFTFLFSHKVLPHQTGLIKYINIRCFLQMPVRVNIAGINAMVFGAAAPREFIQRFPIQLL